MNFTLIKNPDDKLITEIISYCLKSKPYEFCNLGSRKLSIFKIKEYVDCLFEHCEVYISRDLGELFFIAVSKEGERANLEFIFCNQYKMYDYFPTFRSYFKQINPKVKFFYAEITRKYKTNKLISFIKKNDKVATINLDNDKICVLWNT